MEKTLQQRIAGIWVGAAAVFVSAWMPWGTMVIQPSVKIPGVNGGSDVLPLPFPFPEVSHTFTGWMGTVTLMGVRTPTWFSVALAFAAAVTATLWATRVWDPPRWLPALLAGVGLAQVLSVTTVLALGKGGQIEGGILIAIASLFGLITACVRLKRATSPEYREAV